MEFNGNTYPDVKLSCNRENMTKFVEALESGEYEQGTGRLLTINLDGKKKFCCLGVACDVSNLGHWEVVGEYILPERHARLWLPDAVQRWLGIDGYGSDMLSLTGNYGSLTLTAVAMNDKGATFAEIAAAIRKVYLSDEEPSGE